MSAPLLPPACGLCGAWQPPEKPGKGQCRRRSPFAIQDARTGAWSSMWPRTWPHEWCLAFVPKDEPEPEDMLERVEVARVTLYEGPEEPTDERP